MTPSIQRWLPVLTACWLLLGVTLVSAADLKRVEVAKDVYALIGPTGPRTAENDALNCNLGFIVTQQGVVLIDSGASRAGATRIEDAVRAVTEAPIRWVINTGSQDHRWLGNGYFAEQGAEIIALRRTVETQADLGGPHLRRLGAVLGDRLEGTEPVTASKPLPGDQASLALGGAQIELLYLGNAHFPGDALVWLPTQRILFTGDLVYLDRLLGVLPASRVREWQAAFHRMEAMKPEVLVPGHGGVGDLAKAQRDTGDYLDWLVAEVGAAQADWEPLDEVVARLAEAPQFSRLENFDALHKSNINRAYLDFERGAD
ncbi:MBL fold metallo-hydrolase [Thiorhodococcus minor]|uniref:MBL fold metallo-hydrolase n=1 Tax=Thiorhodococcus minor TaxID=57489 RepID=A0A6M0K470_9GAMM|nr:MBL fold metallo-hydrolase [Thiorhodococcus minor]NEV64051.1 MBL fold metallo-hydrolase [Thiorhodococcus minor]